MLVAGLMSGTSADGIDAAIVEIAGLGWKTRLRLVAFHFAPYPAAIREQVLKVAGTASIPTGEISQLNFLLGELFAKACLRACSKAGISPDRLKLIGSHGQTIFHQGKAERFCGQSVHSTMQIAEPAVIAERTGVTTIADFRPADMAAGGQGAPLVPFFDYLLFRDSKKGRVIVNIGGIANLTAIPAGGSVEEVMAFDTGPGNMILDSLVDIGTGGAQKYDPGGKLAAKGTVSEAHVKKLLAQPYFRQPPPKSAGREQFGRAYVEQHFMPMIAGPSHDLASGLATAAALTAESIARAVAKSVLPKFSVAECFVSGGGVRNRFLMSQLKARLAEKVPSLRLLPTEKAGIPADAKEAVAFAVLAYHTFHRLPGNVCSATGARHPAVLGKIAYGKP